MNLIWMALILTGVAWSLLQGPEGALRMTEGIFRGAQDAVTLAFALVGILAFWSGMMRLAEAGGITRWIAKALSPLVRRLFPDIPRDHPANASIIMALSANVLGLGNAATPLGLKAMEDLATLNAKPGTASNAMCTFLALCTSGLTLIPGTVIAVRAASGSANPGAVVGTTIAATIVSTCVALASDRMLRRER